MPGIDLTFFAAGQTMAGTTKKGVALRAKYALRYEEETYQDKDRPSNSLFESLPSIDALIEFMIR
jgi:hypothetical protein